jgi:hypothetical protein
VRTGKAVGELDYATEELLSYCDVVKSTAHIHMATASPDIDVKGRVWIG